MFQKGHRPSYREQYDFGESHMAYKLLHRILHIYKTQEEQFLLAQQVWAITVQMQEQ